MLHPMGQISLGTQGKSIVPFALSPFHTWVIIVIFVFCFDLPSGFLKVWESHW